MRSQMQSLDIKRPAEWSSRVVASAMLIDCPAVAAAATAILSLLSQPTALSLQFQICTVARSILLLDLLDLLCRPTVPTDLFCSTVSTDRHSD